MIGLARTPDRAVLSKTPEAHLHAALAARFATKPIAHWQTQITG